LKRAPRGFRRLRRIGPGSDSAGCAALRISRHPTPRRHMDIREPLTVVNTEVRASARGTRSAWRRITGSAAIVIRGTASGCAISQILATGTSSKFVPSATYDGRSPPHRANGILPTLTPTSLSRILASLDGRFRYHGKPPHNAPSSADGRSNARAGLNKPGWNKPNGQTRPANNTTGGICWKREPPISWWPTASFATSRQWLVDALALHSPGMRVASLPATSSNHRPHALASGPATGMLWKTRLPHRLSPECGGMREAMPSRGLDTAGNVDRRLLRNRFRRNQRQCMDLDGLHDSEFAATSALNRAPRSIPNANYQHRHERHHPDMRTKKRPQSWKTRSIARFRRISSSVRATRSPQSSVEHDTRTCNDILPTWLQTTPLPTPRSRDRHLSGTRAPSGLLRHAATWDTIGLPAGKCRAHCVNRPRYSGGSEYVRNNWCR